MQKVLIANRGEIAVRVIRACRDAGYESVAVYADPDRDALHVRMADEAFALGGTTPGDSYLVIDKVIDAAKKSGADAVHPGYGFLSENADFAQAVIDAGLTWIGPSPKSIADLGDKAVARHIAERAGAPLVAGTKDPVKDADEVVQFAEEHGLPIAIKAVYGGGGRGMKIAREMNEVADLYESAVREATSAFGRGECFVERYLDRSRHVEAQVLADQHGNVIVVGTRDCSLQRRNQKLVEEAPAPFLTDEQRATIHASAKAICREADYYGAGTVEYLVGNDGVISFLEVNTRLQVEHPVTEETSGIDLVREQFRIAEGEKLRFEVDPTPRGHAFEFRINGEDPGRNFLPGAGHRHELCRTGRSGRARRLRHRGLVRHRRRVRLAAGKADRQRRDPRRGAAARPPGAGRVRRGRHGDGVAVPPCGRARRGVHGRAVHHLHAVDRDRVRQPDRAVRRGRGGGRRRRSRARPSWSRSAASGSRSRCPPGSAVAAAAGGARKPAPKRSAGKKSAAAASGDSLTAPMQGTIVKVAVADGDTVEAGQTIVVLEAMKMEQPLNAHKAGTVAKLTAEVGAVVTSGSVICDITD